MICGNNRVQRLKLSANPTKSGVRRVKGLIAFACVPGLMLLSAGIRPDPPSDGVPVFVDVTPASGIRFHHINGPADRKDYIFEAKGGGIGFFDYDNDGWLDVFAVQGATVETAGTERNQLSRLFRNNRDGTFTDVTETAGLTVRRWGMGVTFGDYNNDGWVDIYLTCLGPNVLYRNNGDGTFTDVTEQAGVGDPRWSTSAAFADYDQDGDLDLYVANYIDAGVDHLPEKSSACTYLGRVVMCGPRGLTGSRDALFRNEGDGTFSEVSQQTGAFDAEKYFGLSAVWSDLDNDGDLDLIVGKDATPNYLFENRGDGTFEDMGFLSGLAVNGDGIMQASMGIDVGDYNNDGLMDVFITHFASDYSTLYRNEGGLLFKDVTGEAGIQAAEWLLVAWSTRFFDVNHDGWKDILHVNGHVYPFLLYIDHREKYRQPPTLYLNRRDGTFIEVSSQAGPDFAVPAVSRGAAFGDYDNDGDYDMIVANLNESLRLYRNDRTDQGHWVMFRLQDSKTGCEPLGARVRVTAGGLSQIGEYRRAVGIYSASDPRVHFGLGPNTRIDEVVVTWLDGGTQTFTDVPADQHYLVDSKTGLREEEFAAP